MTFPSLWPKYLTDYIEKKKRSILAHYQFQSSWLGMNAVAAQLMDVEIHWQKLLTPARTRKQKVKPYKGTRSLQEPVLSAPPPPVDPISEMRHNIIIASHTGNHAFKT